VIEILFCDDQLDHDHAMEIQSVIKNRMLEDPLGQLTLRIVPGQSEEIFPAYQMCPKCGHNLCNIETLTTIELNYTVQEKTDLEWVDTNNLKVDKFPIKEDQTPKLRWVYNSLGVLGKQFRVIFSSGFIHQDIKVDAFPLEFRVDLCPKECLSEWTNPIAKITIALNEGLHDF